MTGKHSAGPRLANESALGTYCATWTSSDGVRMGIEWGEGMTCPIAFRGRVVRDVAMPERFGWRKPRKYADFKQFAQAFADKYEAGDDA